MEQELDGAERGPAGQCGPGWEAETCPWLPSPGRGLVAEQAGARPGLPRESTSHQQGSRASKQAGRGLTVASAPGPHPRRLRGD